ncbi:MULTISPECIES: sulfite exporter TauE/SafE family protein [unclassified Sulfitobacter]|uniref:sulfite exporter TauE/SafE family protein n=1 Tax=unclassified Sulfitobacter TaxID=196795 RepID=UPI0007C31BEB|nr:MULTISPECIES: sulfite exporter TauE/SafE family protein [unclassified Sulfitobacter]KZY03368.1 hypothetical protein A3721_03420 [Sulfitobacter sp. HI0023]KZY22913.1 hypothetical protein A3728_09805 [Sulfitobacter sp. HI0040]KZZ70292.1 hypothetical protein A3764_08020 [Sulfitobacter sp. HI0129]
MPDALMAALQTDGLALLALAVVIAGLVRGFAGFGSAMIIMPVASSVLPPIEAVIFLVAAELVGPLPNAPAALRAGRPREVGRLVLGAALALPVGLWVLSLIEPEAFGWIISGIVLTLLALLLTGWRYRGAMTRRLVTATGALGGFLTGFSGIPGPPVIMLYMASTLPASVVRANLTLYLLAVDLLLFPVLWLMDLMSWNIILLGLLAGVPNLLGNVLGARLFDPAAERLFRGVAYIVIAASAIIGLPVWKG